MAKDQETTDQRVSFPYLRIAKKYGIDYGDVIRYAEYIEQGPKEWPCCQWQADVSVAWLAEFFYR
jgi:hypothetical protein